ncbi:MAG: hypothetical protein PVJ76_14800 [Gemmatimonadota bacterium]
MWDIAKSRTRSLYGFGLAVDLVPASYGGRHVYWQWSRVLDRENWDRIPVSRRWSPPQAVIEAQQGPERPGRTHGSLS